MLLQSDKVHIFAIEYGCRAVTGAVIDTNADSDLLRWASHFGSFEYLLQ